MFDKVCLQRCDHTGIMPNDVVYVARFYAHTKNVRARAHTSTPVSGGAVCARDDGGTNLPYTHECRGYLCARAAAHLLTRH